jgi:predicted Zn-dependent protease
VEASIRSFKPLNDPALINVQPARIELVTLPSAMTSAQFLQRHPSTIPEAQVLIINGIQATSTLPRGALMKRVVGGIGS